LKIKFREEIDPIQTDWQYEEKSLFQVAGLGLALRPEYDKKVKCVN